jgi:hypothetical protein
MRQRWRRFEVVGKLGIHLPALPHGGV